MFRTLGCSEHLRYSMYGSKPLEVFKSQDVTGTILVLFTSLSYLLLVWQGRSPLSADNSGNDGAR